MATRKWHLTGKVRCHYPIPTPTGVDFKAAAELGVKAIWALSLPGKVAPVTAGKAIKTVIYNILHELGV